MNPDKEKLLFDTFPQLFQPLEVREDMVKSCMYWGFECGEGWFKIIYDLLNDISKLNVPVVITQVKEKYGTLRIYHDGGNADVEALIDKAESLSSKTCEVCGRAGKLSGKGWYNTLCDLHVKE